jgi:hypothetical protein
MKSKTTCALKIMLLSVALVSLQACATNPGSYNNVARAYDTTGIIPVKPYTRTIFSTNDF